MNPRSYTMRYAAPDKRATIIKVSVKVEVKSWFSGNVPRYSPYPFYYTGTFCSPCWLMGRLLTDLHAPSTFCSIAAVPYSPSFCCQEVFCCLTLPAIRCALAYLFRVFEVDTPDSFVICQLSGIHKYISVLWRVNRQTSCRYFHYSKYYNSCKVVFSSWLNL